MAYHPYQFVDEVLLHSVYYSFTIISFFSSSSDYAVV